jgi:hypothetical protein
MINKVKLRKRKMSKIFDIVVCGPHAEYSKNTKIIGFIDTIKHIYKLDDEKLKLFLNNGVKINKNLYYILKHANICPYLEKKFIA